MTIVTKIVLSYFTTFGGGTTAPPDLCDVVNPDTGTPTICEAHRKDAPVLDADVCCVGEECELQTGTTCDAEQTRYHCDYGKADENGRVSCFFEAPDYCDAHPCESGGGMDYHPGAQAEWVCCSYGVCTELPYSLLHLCNIGELFWCWSLVTLQDLTVECVDGE